MINVAACSVRGAAAGNAQSYGVYQAADGCQILIAYQGASDDIIRISYSKGGLFTLAGLHVTSDSISMPEVQTSATATVTLRDSTSQLRQGLSVGDGPVDAIYSAIQRLTGFEAKLTDYRIRAVTKGKEALGEVQIELEHNSTRVHGRGVSTDILEASALAYLAAINRLRSLSNRERLVHQHTGV